MGFTNGFPEREWEDLGEVYEALRSEYETYVEMKTMELLLEANEKRLFSRRGKPLDETNEESKEEESPCASLPGKIAS